MVDSVAGPLRKRHEVGTPGGAHPLVLTSGSVVDDSSLLAVSVSRTDHMARAKSSTIDMPKPDEPPVARARVTAHENGRT